MTELKGEIEISVINWRYQYYTIMKRATREEISREIDLGNTINQTYLIDTSRTLQPLHRTYSFQMKMEHSLK